MLLLGVGYLHIKGRSLGSLEMFNPPSMAKEQSLGVQSRRTHEAPLQKEEQKEDLGAALLYSSTEEPLSSEPPSDEVSPERKPRAVSPERKRNT